MLRTAAGVIKPQKAFTMRILLCLILVFSSCLPSLAQVPLVVPLGDSPSRGAADAPVVMIEFIDFQ
jgi:hypothetical protein